MKCRIVAFLLWSACETCHSVQDENARENPITVVKREVADDGKAPIPITLLLTRHALSCANLVKEYPKNNEYRAHLHALILDPPLSECGKYRSRRLREPIKEALVRDGHAPVSFVLASHLLRAQQTAAYMYGTEKKIMVVPYISEAGIGLDNQQRIRYDEHGKPVDEFGRPIEKSYTDTQYLKNIATPKRGRGWAKYAKNLTVWAANGVLDTVNDAFKFSEGEKVSGTTQPDWNNFEDFMRDTFLPKMIPKPEHPVTIAVVSHSHFMKGDKVCGRKPENNEIFKLQYWYAPESPSPEDQFVRRKLDGWEGCPGLVMPAGGPGTPGLPLLTSQMDTEKQKTAGSRRILCRDESIDDVGCYEDKVTLDSDDRETLANADLTLQQCCTAFNPNEAAPDENGYAAKTIGKAYMVDPEYYRKATPGLFAWRQRFRGGDDVEGHTPEPPDDVEGQTPEPPGHQTQVRRLRSAVRKFVTRFVRTR